MLLSKVLSQLTLSGGGADWSSFDQPEAEAMAEFLIDLGVPHDAMLLESDSLTTHQNAVRTRWPPRTGRSSVADDLRAAHAPRDGELRECGHRRDPRADGHREAVPPPGSTRTLKDYLGLPAYRSRGWSIVSKA